MDDCLMTNSIFDKNVKNRFWKLVIRQGPECWIWDGALSKSGYGQFNLYGETVYAHRMSWIMHYGNIPESLLVLHKCDEKRCVNPTHLYVGTHIDNMSDRITR